MTGREYFELVHPEDLDAARRELGGMFVARPGTHVTGEVRMRRQDGGWSWVHYRAGNLLHDPAVEALALNLRDITVRKQAEELLERERKQLLAIIESLDEAVGVWNSDGSLVLINDATAKLYGFEMKEQMLKHLSDYADVQVWTMDGCELPQEEWPPSRVLRGETFSNWELEQYIPSINKRFIGSNSGRPVRDVNGKIIFGVTSVRDITERKQAEEALAIQHTELQLILDSSPAMIFYKDRENRFLRVNRAFAESIARPVKQLEGGSAFDLYSQEQAEAYWNDDREVMATGKSKLGIVELMQTPAGERWLQTDKVPSRDAQGNTTGIIGFAVDITERRRAEQDVERFKALMDHNPSLVFLKDDSGKYVYLNRAYETHFVGSKDWLGKTDFDFWPKESAELFRANDAEVLKSRETKQYLEDSTSLDGTRYCWLCDKFVFVDSQDRKYLGGIGIDVTDRVRAEEALRKSEERFRALFENMQDGCALCQMVFDDAGQPVDFIYLAVNSAFGRLTGLENIVGKRVTEVLPGIREAHPELLLTYGRVARGCQPERFEIEFKPLAKWLTVSVYQTEPDHFAAVFDDITARKQAEAEIQAQRDLLDVVFQHMPAAVNLIRGRDLQLLMANPAYRALAPGKTEFVGKTLDQIWPETGRDFSALCRRVLDTGEPHHAVDDRYTIQRQPGGPLEEAYFNWSLYRVRLPGDDGWGIFNTAWETTERKQAELAARQGLQTLAELIERSPFGIYIVDAQFRIAMMNSSSQEGAFRNVQPVVGRPFDEAMRILWPEDVAAEIIGHFRHALDTGEPYFSRDFINLRHDTEIVEAYEWELHRMTLPDGQHGVICYYYDSTKLRQAEAALRESEARLRRIAQAGQIGFVEWNAATDKSYWSTEHYELLGFEPGSTVTWERWRDGLYPADRDRVLANAARLLERGRQEGQVRGHKDEYRFIRPDGVVAWLEADISLDMTDGEPIIRGSLRDITARKQAEDALRASEERYRGLMGVLPTAVYTCDVEGRITFFNERAAEFWGRRPQPGDTDERFCGSFRLWLPDGRPLPHDRTPMARAIRDGAGFRSEEVVIERPDGRRIHVLINIDPLRDAEGRITGAINAFADITERKQAEDALRASEEKYRNLFANMAEEVHLWQLVRDDAGNIQTWRLVDANPPTLKSWGRDHVAEVQGKTTDEIFGPGATEHYRAIVEKIMTEGASHSFEDYFPNLDKHFRFTSVPMGEYFLTTGADISGIKKAELALRESREDLDRAQTVGQIGSWRLDVRRNLLTWSDENHRIFGLPKGTPLNYETFLSTIHPDDRQYVDTQWKACLSGAPYDIEHRIVVNGQVKWVRERAYLESDQTGELLGGFGITQDITGRKQAEEELRESVAKTEKAEGELRKLNETLEERVVERTAEVRQLADRLRALTAELTLSEHRERKRLAQLLHDGLQQILVASQLRLARLAHVQDQEVRQCAREVGDLLSESIQLSRSLTADLSPPILHECGLVPALEWLTHSLLDKQGLEVELETHTELEPTAEELNILLFLAARELLFNIVKHAGVKTARVRVAKRDEMIELTVSDQGVGFDPAQVLKHGGNSGGFGLFSIRERLKLLGGTLEIHSAAGQGSRFVLRAPLPDSAGTATAPIKQPRKISVTNASHETGGRSKAGKIRVMLVDDHQVMRQGLCRLILNERDMDMVGEAADGESAIRLAREIHPDLILMDVSMPGMNGIEATRIIHAELPEIRIIGFSMFVETERAEAMRAAGAVNYLIKSGPSQELIAAIRACMQEGL